MMHVRSTWYDHVSCNPRMQEDRKFKVILENITQFLPKDYTILVET